MFSGEDFPNKTNPLIPPCCCGEKESPGGNPETRHWELRVCLTKWGANELLIIAWF